MDKNIEMVAKALRDCQSEHGTLKEGVRFISPEWMPLGDTYLGLSVIYGSTVATLTLSAPATYQQARYFEDSISGWEG